MNPVRDLLKSGKTVVGTAGSLYEDNMAMLADSGLDFILFDSQHAPVEVKQYQRAIQAMRGKKATPIVRVSANRADVICLGYGQDTCKKVSQGREGRLGSDALDDLPHHGPADAAR
jgi:2-keto-3-deoxy-L-rhamnonate aldolase RhmA